MPVSIGEVVTCAQRHKLRGSRNEKTWSERHLGRV